MDLRADQGRGDSDFGLMTYDPAYTNTASCTTSRITFIDGDKGILEYRGYPIEQLAEQSNFLETSYAPPHRRRAAHAPQLDEFTHDHAPHDGAREHPGVHRRVPLRRAPDGHPGEHRGGALDVLSRRQERRRPGVPPPADLPPHRQDADARGLRVPPPPRPALRLPGQRPQLRRQLPEHDVQDDRGEVQAEPGAREGARRAVHPARGPRAELLHHRHARRGLVAESDPYSAHGGGMRGALRPAPRRRQRGRAAHAQRDRQQGQHPRSS
jgi:hypothetical protein